MSIHINALPGSMAKTVLMPGDPLRAKWIADHFLEQAVLVSQTRNVLFYTGTYKGKPISVGASGMGCPSIGIYSYELYTEFGADHIIRIGTCGAYTDELALGDLINVSLSASESTFARFAWGIEADAIPPPGMAFSAINEAASLGSDGQAARGRLRVAPVHSSDIFYRSSQEVPEIALRHLCVAVEMESFALFANAQHLNKTAACLLTVSDVIPTHERMSPDEREKSLAPMVTLALDACLELP
jgi:purine-nucleoside phosphorylase